MDGGQHAGAGEKGAEDHQHIGQDDQEHVPVFEHALLLLHHYRMQESSPAQPGHEGRDLDRIPAPITAPAEHVIRPPAAQDQAQREEQPGHQRPAPGDPDPAVIGPARDQRGDGEGVRDHEGHEAQVQHRGMDDHPRVPQQRIQALAVGGYQRAGALRAEEGHHRPPLGVKPEPPEGVFDEDDQR